MGLGFEIRISEKLISDLGVKKALDSGSRGQKPPDSGVKKAPDPDP
jgi:hypothetical protein